MRGEYFARKRWAEICDAEGDENTDGNQMVLILVSFILLPFLWSYKEKVKHYFPQDTAGQIQLAISLAFQNIHN